MAIVVVAEAVTPCRWCGESHDERALCGPIRRGLSRRSFLFLGATAAIGLIVQPSLALPQPIVVSNVGPVEHRVAALVAEVWNQIIGDTPEQSMFMEQQFLWLMRDQLRARLTE